MYSQYIIHTYRTVLSSAGNDGRVRLWKQTVGGVWRAAGTISVEQSEERGAAATAAGSGVGGGDVDME
jgi:nucleoporin SEH1